MLSDTSDTKDTYEVDDASQETSPDTNKLSPAGQRSMQGMGANQKESKPEIDHSDKPREWKDRGMQMVKTADLPDPDGVQSEQDFEKVPAAEMSEGFRRLDEMKPIIASGKGASSGYWAGVDRQQGLDPTAGYQRTYDSFYGSTAIKVSRDGDVYDIENGRHRVWLAKRLGVEELPVRLRERA